jgi:hypothetical protein
MTWWRKAAAACALAATLGAAAPAQAGYLEDAGWGSLSALANLLYIPAKLTYAVLGGVTGGLAYGLTAGDLDTAQNVWTTSMGGTYVLTPRNLRGEDPIAYAYYPTPAPVAATAAVQDDAGWTAAEMPADSLGGASLGSSTGGTGSSGGLAEQPAAGF